MITGEYVLLSTMGKNKKYDRHFETFEHLLEWAFIFPNSPQIAKKKIHWVTCLPITVENQGTLRLTMGRNEFFFFHLGVTNCQWVDHHVLNLFDLWLEHKKTHKLQSKS